MKITKSELKEIILQEINELVPSDFNPSQVLNRYQTNVFTTEVNAVLANMDQMAKEIQKNDGLTRKDLVFIKEKLFDDLYAKISYVEDVLNDRMKRKDEG
jgi:hypothetical protein|tara:strand:+ start:1460 stop:1759 length:300 start_codon:yes stop_codon:yes gene_type:complete